MARGATMRAAFYEGPRKFATGTLPVPEPGAGEALLRMRRVGICGTDLHIFQGHLDHRVPRGGVTGHETFGQVVRAPRDSGFSVGDRVLFVGRSRSWRARQTRKELLALDVDVMARDL